MPDTTLLDRVTAADGVVAGLVAETGLKRSDAALLLGPGHADLLASAPYDQVARWLKVDRVDAGRVESVVAVDEPTCPRCRLHGLPEHDGLCRPCSKAVEDYALVGTTPD
jgi:tRNA(Ile2) C34 agmatinyltransferase TiaS